MGFTKKGVFFHVGLVNVGNNNLTYHYGYAKWKLGAIKPLIEITEGKQGIELLLSDESKVSFNAKFLDKEKEFFFEILPKEKGEMVRKVFVDGQEGRCLVIFDEDKECQKVDVIQKDQQVKDSSLVLALSERSAMEVELTGGKGSSLANLMKLSSILEDKKDSRGFQVPNGVVVSTNAYSLLLKENKGIESEVNKLQRLAWSEKRENLKNECEDVINYINSQKVPQKIRSQIDAKLKSTFNEYSNKLFAVLFSCW